MRKIKKKLPGLLLCAAIGGAGYFLGGIFNRIGGVMISLFIGIAAGNFLTVSRKIEPGIVFTNKKVLPFAIALLGIELRPETFLSLGISTIALIILLMIITFASALIFGRIFGVSKKTAVLLGCGNAVCGSSAIASAAKVIMGSEEETGLSIAAVNFMGTLGLFMLPAALTAFGFNEARSAHIIGGVLQAVGQVVASGYSMGKAVGSAAVIVKMSRVLLLGPLLFILSLVYQRKKSSSAPSGIKREFPVPPFIIGFFLVSIGGNLPFIPDFILKSISYAAEIFLAVAMAGIGMNIKLRSFTTCGPQILFTEISIMAVQLAAAFSLTALLS